MELYEKNKLEKIIKVTLFYKNPYKEMFMKLHTLYILKYNRNIIRIPKKIVHNNIVDIF